MDTHDMLTVKEVARFLSYSERHLRQLIHFGFVTAYKLGKRSPTRGPLDYFKGSESAPFE